MYDKENNTYIEEFLVDIDDMPFVPEGIPGINVPQINSEISVEV